MKETVTISTDIAARQGPLDRTWRYIGYDECNYTYVPEGIDLLKKFGNLEDAPYYFRTHFLFCTGNIHHTYKWGSTNIYSEDEQGNVVCDFTTFDRIIDAYLESNGKPFVELGFMPLELVDPKYLSATNKPWEFYHEYRYLGSACPPKDYQKWYDLVYQTVQHCCEKYGADEVATWYWELWNEPDIFYWRGTIQEYCKLYDYTEKAVHDACSATRLAGPATTGPVEGQYNAKFLDLFLNHCQSGVNYCTGKEGTRLDYITFHVKGGGFPFNPKAEKSVPSVKSFIRQCKLGMEIIRKNGYADLEVVLSEADPDGWAAGGIYDNPNMKFRNTEYYATYVAASYIQLMQLCKEMNMTVKPLAWAFMFVGERCFEGTRAFTTQGIDKPVFNLFKMLAQMGDEQVPLISTGTRQILDDDNDFSEGYGPDINGISSVHEDGTVSMLLYSHHDDWDQQGESSVTLAVESLQAGSQVKVQLSMIDVKASNTNTRWKELGSPEYPSDEQREKIKEKEDLELVLDKIMTVDNKGCLNLDLNMKTHAVCLANITPVK